MSERVRGGERKKERQREMGKKNNNMNFSLLSNMDFPLHHISVGPDETKVIRETQVGHLRAITAERGYCLSSKANAAPVREVQKVHSCFICYPKSGLQIIKQH